MLEIQDYKDRVAAICEQFAQALPYEPDQVEAETWQELADELAELASVVSSAAGRLASYAGNASKRASE